MARSISNPLKCIESCAKSKREKFRRFKRVMMHLEVDDSE